MNKSFISLTLCAFILAGCSLSPKLEAPKVEFDAQSNETLIQTVNKEWWKEYNDATLNALVDEALKNNRDLEIALLNISLARASLSLTNADRYPSLNAQAGASRTQTSEETLSSGGRRMTFNDFSLSAILSYEVDLWGRVSSLSKASKAQLLASKASADAVKLSLSAGVVDTYFALISLKEQQKIASDTVSARDESLALTKIKYEFGAINEAILRQEETLLSSAKLTRDSIDQAIIATSSALNLLLGREPSQIKTIKESVASVLPEDIAVPAYLPSIILENRPDIEAAYEQLVSSNELIGVSRAAYFPTLSLSALFGVESADIDNLLKSSAKTWNVGGSLVAPLINFGKTGANVDIAKISRDISAVQYEKTVNNAFKEVYDAINQRAILEASLKSQLELEQAIQRTLELVQDQYDAGFVDYISLLDAKRSLLSAQLGTVQTKQALLSSGVSLFKALGGGWSKD